MLNKYFGSFLLLGSLTSCVSTTQSIAASDQLVDSEIIDFRGMVFGTKAKPYLEWNSLGSLDQQDRIQIFTIKGDVLKIGEIELDSIEYSFFDGKLYRVTINAGRDDNLCSEAEKIKSSIEEKYKTKLSLQLPIKSGYRFYNVSFKNLSIVVSCDSLFSDGPYPKTTTDILDPILSEAADEHMKKSHEKIKKEKASEGAKNL